MLCMFHSHFKVTYVPRGLGAIVVYFLLLLIVLVAPAFICFGMQNFWLQTNDFFEMPSISFSGNCALRVTTVLGKEYLWTCSELFNEEHLYGTPIGILPFFSMYHDRNTDGKVTDITIVLSVRINELSQSIYDGPITLPTGETLDAIQEAYFLPEFAYKVNNYLMKVNMTVAPLMHYVRPSEYIPSETDITAISSGPLCAITAADMDFYSTELLINSRYVRYTNVYAVSPLSDVTQPAELMNLPVFADAYSSRNQTVVTRVYTQSSGGLSLLGEEFTRSMLEDLDSLNAFTWRVHLRVLPAHIFYRPSITEALKWAWVQYFSVAFVLQWVLWNVRGMIVTLGLVETRAVYTARTSR